MHGDRNGDWTYTLGGHHQPHSCHICYILKFEPTHFFSVSLSWAMLHLYKYFIARGKAPPVDCPIESEARSFIDACCQGDLNLRPTVDNLKKT